MITFAELAAKVARRELSKHELEEQKYFELDPVRSRAFRPVFRINTEAVDVGGVELAANSAGHALALDAEQAVQDVRRQSFRAAERERAPAAPRIIAEGDSWFSLPFVTTAIDALQRQGHDIRNLAKAGDTLENMLQKRQYVPHLQTRQVTHFLFSGGGNDVLGGLRSLLNLFDFDHTDPHNPSDVAFYIKPEFRLVLQVLRTNYAALIDDVRSVSPSTILVVNGYAYTPPLAHGPSLGDDFEFLGFDLAHGHLQLAWAIVRSMVDRFNLLLENLAGSTANVRYCDLRPALRQDDRADWFDELHPSRRGAEKVAALLAQELPAPALVPAAA